MSLFMNLLWLLFGGIFIAIEYLISSLLMMITIIGIPFGIQTLKMAVLALMPFGKEVRSRPDSGGCLSLVMNVLWIFLGGYLDLPFSSGMGNFAVHHNYWYSLRQAAFQTGRTGAHSVWEGDCGKIKPIHPFHPLMLMNRGFQPVCKG